MKAAERLQEVVDLEQRLLEPETRRDRGRLEALLHPDFREIGASGRAWTREEVVTALLEEPAEAHPPATDFDAREVADGVVLLTYATPRSLRSSLWVGDGTGGWRLLFHQGTPASG